jgi:hypothetical protein
MEGDRAADRSGERKTGHGGRGPLRLALVRHGRPLIERTQPVAGRAFGAWLRRYDRARIDPEHPPPPALRTLARESALLVTSPLPRALASLALLDPREPLVIDGVREAPLPVRFSSGLPLPPDLWSALARVAWLAGWSPGAESFAESRRRAAAAARQLDGLARRHGSVLVLGHGFMNGLIGLGLLRRGWRGRWRIGGAFWSSSVYERAPRPSPPEPAAAP